MILIGAIVIGAIAAFGLLTYVRGVEDDKFAGSELVQVYMVQQDIPKNTPGEQAEPGGYVSLESIPVEFAPTNRITQLEQIHNQVAVNDIAVNQILVPGLFVPPQQAQISFSEYLTGNNVALSIALDQVRSVGGFLQPDDEVNMLVTNAGLQAEAALVEADAPEPAEGEEEEDETAGVYTQPARVLYQRVKILAIGAELPLLPGQVPDAEVAPTGTGTITLEVPMEAAVRIASVDAAQIVLTLTPDDYVAEVVPPLTDADITGLLPGEDPARLTPYGPDGIEDALDDGFAFSDDQLSEGGSDGASEGTDSTGEGDGVDPAATDDVTDESGEG